MEEQITALQKLIGALIEFFVSYSFQVIGAILILILGVVIGSWVSRVMLRFFEKKKMDIAPSKFLTGTVKILILTFAVIVALGKFGITIAPFVAALGASGLLDIYNAFQTNQIKIPFPQRDIHIVSQPTAASQSIGVIQKI